MKKLLFIILMLLTFSANALTFVKMGVKQVCGKITEVYGLADDGNVYKAQYDKLSTKDQAIIQLGVDTGTILVINSTDTKKCI